MTEGIRRRVKIPGVDEAQVPDFYEDGPKGHEPLNKTALREAERKYKSKNNLDLSQVIDFHNTLDDTVTKETRDLKFKAYEEEIKCKGYSIKGKDGFLYFPSAIPFKIQKKIIRDILEEYIVSGNESNLHPFYEIPEQGLFLNKDKIINTKCENKKNLLGKELLRKLRWVTIGYRYNWTTKEYDFEKSNFPISPTLISFCKSFAAALGYPNYKPEAGIVNFYQPDDSLTCHVDRSEKFMQPPLISLSFGLDGIFLLGGEGRDDEVHAIRVRSGDVSVLAEKSRMYFHGVPRILLQSSFNSYDDLDLDNFMATTRINLNIRQVYE